MLMDEKAYYTAFASCFNRHEGGRDRFDGPLALEEKLKTVFGGSPSKIELKSSKTPSFKPVDSATEDSLVVVVGNDGTIKSFSRSSLMRHPGTFFEAILKSDSTASKVHVDLDKAQLDLVEPYFKKGKPEAVNVVSAYENTLEKTFNYLCIPVTDVCEIGVNLAFNLLLKAAHAMSSKKINRILEETEKVVKEMKNIAAEMAPFENAQSFQENEGESLSEFIPGLVVAELYHRTNATACSDGDDPDVMEHTVLDAELRVQSSYQPSSSDPDSSIETIRIVLSPGSFRKCDPYCAENFIELQSFEKEIREKIEIKKELMCFRQSCHRDYETKWYDTTETWINLCNPTRHHLLSFEDVFESGSVAKFRAFFDLPAEVTDSDILLWLLGLVRWTALPPLYLPTKRPDDYSFFLKDE